MDSVLCSTDKVLGEKLANQRFGSLSATKKLYGVVQDTHCTGKNVKYIVHFSEFASKVFSSHSLKHQATDSISDVSIPPSFLLLLVYASV